MSRAETLVVVEPPEKWPRPHFRTLWQNRDLAYFLSWRDVKIRYKQSLIGIGWAVIQPLLSMIAFTVVFDRVANVPSAGFPYAVFVLSGLIPWIFFSNSVSFASLSLVGNMSLVTKVYFPRILLPISGVLTWSIDLAISFVLLLGVMLLYGVTPPLTVLLVPFLAFLILLVALSVSLLLSALNVEYRDVRHMLPFMIQLWLFVTPVIYPSSAVEGSFAFVYGLNPMVGTIDAFRWAVLGTPAPDLTFLIPSFGMVLLLLVAGGFYFLKAEQRFADVI